MTNAWDAFITFITMPVVVFIIKRVIGIAIIGWLLSVVFRDLRDIRDTRKKETPPRRDDDDNFPPDAAALGV